MTRSVNVERSNAKDDAHHLLDSIGKNSRQPVAQCAYQVEEGISLLHIVTGIVCREKVDASYQ